MLLGEAALEWGALDAGWVLLTVGGVLVHVDVSNVGEGVFVSAAMGPAVDGCPLPVVVAGPMEGVWVMFAVPVEGVRVILGPLFISSSILLVGPFPFLSVFYFLPWGCSVLVAGGSWLLCGLGFILWASVFQS